jgi:outer membrane protein OmpA-like peptidoglycan-associated protein
MVVMVIGAAGVVVTLPAGAVGDNALDTYLMSDPLPNSVAVSTSTLELAATVTDNLENTDLAGRAFERTSLAAWVTTAPQSEVIDEIADFTVLPPGAPSGALTSICPVTATTTTTTPSTTTTTIPSTTTTTIPSADALIPGSAEASCTDAQSGLEKTGIAWIEQNVLVLFVTIGLTNSESDSIAATQYGLIPTGGIDLSASRSFVVQRFALNSAVLSSAMKLTINRDAMVTSNSAPTSVRFSGRKSSSGSSGASHALAEKRIGAVYRYFVSCLRQDGTPAETLSAIHLGSGQPTVSAIVSTPAASSGVVSINLNYLK